MRIGTAAGGLAIVLTLLAMADTDAAATWGYSASSGADCQLSIPTLDTKFRPKASGARNESTTASYFVICPARGFSSALDTVTQVVADFSYMPPPGVSGATISCSAVSGSASAANLRYSTKSTTFPGYAPLAWTGDDFGGLAGWPIPNSLVMSVDVDRLRKAPIRILTSGGEEKIEALLGAMTLVAPTILITDEESAKRMLEAVSAG